MASASDIASLIVQGIKPPNGTQDISYHQGIVKSWDPTSGVNTVEVNGVILSNLSSLQTGMGNAFYPGDVVQVQRVQTKYSIIGRISAPNGRTGSAPISTTEDGSFITGSQNTWKDLDGGAGVSPRVTVRIGNSCLVMFGVSQLITSNAELTCSLVFTGPVNSNPDDGIVGYTFTAGNATNTNDQVTQSPQKQLMIYRNTGVLDLGNGEWGYFTPGVYTFSLKYQWQAIGSGTGPGVFSPWLTVIPF